MIPNNLFLRIYFNIKLYAHCKRISEIYKKNTLQHCLEILSSDKYIKSINASEEISAIYLSKRIGLINKFLQIDNCLANSMCLFLAIKNRKNISFVIGVSDNFIENSFSHCWVEINGVAINEKRAIMEYKSVIRIDK